MAKVQEAVLKAKLKSKDEKPVKAERDALAARLQAKGVPAAKVAQAVKAGASRRELVDTLIAYWRSLRAAT